MGATHNTHVCIYMYICTRILQTIVRMRAHAYAELGSRNRIARIAVVPRCSVYTHECMGSPTRSSDTIPSCDTHKCCQPIVKPTIEHHTYIYLTK